MVRSRWSREPGRYAAAASRKTSRLSSAKQSSRIFASANRKTKRRSGRLRKLWLSCAPQGEPTSSNDRSRSGQTREPVRTEVGSPRPCGPSVSLREASERFSSASAESANELEVDGSAQGGAQIEDRHRVCAASAPRSIPSFCSQPNERASGPRATTYSGEFRAAEAPDGEPHCEQHNTGGHHEAQIETRERQSFAAVDGALRRTVRVALRIWMLLWHTE